MLQLFTERLLIRDHLPDDLQDYHELVSDEKAMFYLPFLKTMDLESSRNSLQKIIDDANSNSRKIFMFWVEDIAAKEYIGEAGYHVMMDTAHGKMATIEYFIKEKFWNNGYTSEAMKRIMEFAFTENNVFRFIGQCFRENAGSEAVMKKCGMVKEGEFQMFALQGDQLKDSVQYRILKSEWEGGAE